MAPPEEESSTTEPLAGSDRSRSGTPASIRVAGPDDALAVRRVLDAALLTVDDLVERIRAGAVLVADGRHGVDGAVVLAPEGPSGEGPHGEGPPGGGFIAHERAGDGGDAGGSRDPVDDDLAHVRAIAVRSSRRDRGIGTALLRTATDRFGPLVADFDPSVRPFYESLDCERIRQDEDGRVWALVDP